LHIPTKLHQFLIGTFSVIVQTDGHTDTQTDADKHNTMLCYFADEQGKYNAKAATFGQHE